MIELARIVAGGRLRRTVTFVSTSGGSGGAAGARDLVHRLSGNPIDAVLVLGDLGSRPPRKPIVTAWSDGSQIGPLRLQRTIADAVRQEVATSAGGPGIVTQWTRLAFPGTVGEQGPLVGARPPRGAPVVQRRASAAGRRARRREPPRGLRARGAALARRARRGPGARRVAEPRRRHAAQGAPAVGGPPARRLAPPGPAARDGRRLRARAPPPPAGHPVARVDRRGGRAVRDRGRVRHGAGGHRPADGDAAGAGPRRRDPDRQRRRARRSSRPASCSCSRCSARPLAAAAHGRAAPPRRRPARERR